VEHTGWLVSKDTTKDIDENIASRNGQSYELVIGLVVSSYMVILRGHAFGDMADALADLWGLPGGINGE